MSHGEIAMIRSLADAYEMAVMFRVLALIPGWVQVLVIDPILVDLEGVLDGDLVFEADFMKTCNA